MKRFFFKLPLFFSFFFFSVHVAAQDNSDKTLSQHAKDTNEVKRLIGIADEYRFSKPDSSVIIAEEALSLARQLNFVRGEGQALITLGEDHRLGGDFPQALEALFDALQISRSIGNQEMEAGCLNFIGVAYVDLGESRQGLNYLFQAKELNEKHSFTIMICFGLTSIGVAYEQLNILDSALFFHEHAYQILSNIKSMDITRSPLRSLILRHLGNVQYHLGNYDKALSYYREVISNNDLLNISSSQFQIAEYFFNIKNNTDSSLYYALLAFNNGHRSFQKIFILDASKILAKLYKATNKLDSAYYYHEIALAMNDSLFGQEKTHKIQLLAINEQQRQQEIRQERESLKNKIRIYILLAAVGVFLLLAIIFYRNNRQKQKANKVLETTLTHLRSTQSQLIQSEKMASLGELTAGIAHEIQNPLNFVNNFSDVNTELIDEAEQEMNKGNFNETKAILKNIKENEEKINHHGKRADAIVKGMLQHSRSNSGQKEPTDVNALADEYLRLAYHGLRAKDKSFNADIKTDFDESIGKINIIPQEIGRVILNLINNAFYSVDEKKKQDQDGYEPNVSVSTKKANGKVEISVKDNGNGIPQKVLDKIFQPFFTTKPTGQGTGLGLSLSYDIVRAHGGEIKVKTKENEGTEFIIKLPVG
ncbi:MAG TPA: ATP-binding protein [Chitinophagaceae bacterium]|nr:ATP-binding protein [Chitinophagaceae bacterium]